MSRPSTQLRRLLLVLAVVLPSLGAALTPKRALAQHGGADLSASISTDAVEVGESFTVELVAMVEGNELPSSPRLRPPAGLDAAGPRVSTRIATRWGAGGQHMKRGIGATWQLVAQRPGSYVIPAPTVVVGGSRVVAGHTLRVRVEPASGRRRSPKRPRTWDPFGSSPFAFPGRGSSFPFNFRLGNNPFDDDFFRNDDDRNSLGDSGRKLAMDREPERYVFLRAIADKKKAVVGEQITLSFYAYYRVSFEMSDRHEAPLADFLRVPVLKSPGTYPPEMTRVGGQRYNARLLDRIAIFPLRSGELHTGSLTASFKGRRLGKSVKRASNDVVVQVREPPLDGRPAGYRIGDVGRFRLSGSVQPKEIDAGGSVAVLVRLEGQGSLPHSLPVPERTGIEWLEPEKKADVTVTGDRVGGWRTFGYVVRIAEPGKRYLGRLELPYYDPERREYGVAELDLGNVLVRDSPGATRKDGTASKDPAAAAADADGDGFATIGAPRLTLGAFRPPAREGLQPRTLWALVLVPPLSVLAVGALRRTARKVARRRAARQQDAGALADRALAELKRAAEPKSQAAAAERAIHHAVEAATGLKSRGILLADLDAELRQSGLDTELADEVASLLDACSSLRFEPDPESAPAAALRARTVRLLKRLGRQAAKRGSAGARA